MSLERIWQDSVRKSRLDESELESILDELRPTFTSIAKRIASQCVDDAVQVALIRVVRAIKQNKINMDRPDTIRSMLMSSGVNAMRDEVRKYLRLSWGQTTDEVLESREGGEIDGRAESLTNSEELGPYLSMYLEYVREHGTFKGAHRFVAKKLKVRLSWASSMFHREAKDFISRSGIPHGSTTKDDVTRRLLNA